MRCQLISRRELHIHGFSIFINEAEAYSEAKPSAVRLTLDQRRLGKKVKGGGLRERVALLPSCDGDNHCHRAQRVLHRPACPIFSFAINMRVVRPSMISV